MFKIIISRLHCKLAERPSVFPLLGPLTAEDSHRREGQQPFEAVRSPSNINRHRCWAVRELHRAEHLPGKYNSLPPAVCLCPLKSPVSVPRLPLFFNHPLKMARAVCAPRSQWVVCVFWNVPERMCVRVCFHKGFRHCGAIKMQSCYTLHHKTTISKGWKC